MHGHFRSNIDFWDPDLLNALAAKRPVIIFDQAGVGRSSGEVATTFSGWADSVIALPKAPYIEKIDLLGFSMGGCAAQMVPLNAPNLVRMLILAGTAPSAPSAESDVSGIIWPREVPPTEPFKVLATKIDEADTLEALRYSFLYDTDHGRAAANGYWDRVQERNVSEEPLSLKLLNEEGTERQTASYLTDWMAPKSRNSFGRMGELKMPVLIMNGDNDVLVPTSQSWEMAVKIPNAQLVINPKSGHGSLHQYASEVAGQVNRFLDGELYPASEL